MKDKQHILERITDIFLEYLQQSKQPGTPVVDYKRPDDLKDIFDLSISNKGASDDEILDAIKLYLKYSVRTQHKHFFNQLYGGFNLHAFLGEMTTSLTNTSMYTYEVAPIATLIELDLIERMNKLVGFFNGGGQFVTGGSNANLVAVLCARNKINPKVKHEGILPKKPQTMFVSDQAHYSFLKAANILGLGTNNVVKVKTDPSGRMLPAQLDLEIQKNIQQGGKPFFIAATAGSTVLGSFDPIDAVALIAKKYNLWFHVDGAFGGSVLLSRKHRSLLLGSEKADSFTWDPHKMMTIPLICSAILVKDKSILTETCTSHDTEYLFHDYENKDYDLGIMSLQCGRRVDALKLWLSWKYYGNDGYEKRIDKLIELAKYATEIVIREPNLELMYQTQSVNVCFRYLPNTNHNLNQFNLKLRNVLVKKRKILINYSILNGNLLLRLVFVNPEVTNSDIDVLFDTILTIGNTLLKKGRT